MYLPPSSSALIGRAADLRELDALYAQVVAGQPRAVVVAGEAGIGKSRLLAEFTAGTAQSARVLRGQWVDLRRGRHAIRADHSGAAGARRPGGHRPGARSRRTGSGTRSGCCCQELSDHVTRGASENRLHEGVALLLEHFARERPVVLVIEDLPWADKATLTVLRFLLRAVASGQIMIVLSYRSDDVHRGHPLRVFLTEVERGRRAKRLELRRLTRAQVRERAQSILGHAPDFDLSRERLRAQRGGPLLRRGARGVRGLGAARDAP